MSSSEHVGKRLSSEEVVDLAHVVSGLTEAGLPLGPGLRALSEEVPSRRLKRSFNLLADQLESGESLDEMLGEGNTFGVPSHLKGLVRMGMKTGRLGSVLDQFVRYEYIGAELRRNFWISMTYPIILLTGVLLLSILVGTVIVRDLSVIYKDFGIDLPRATITIIQTSELFRENLPTLMVLAIILGGGLLFLSVSRMLFGEKFSRWATARIPLVGRVAHWTAMAELFHTLGLLIENGVSLPESLSLAADGVRDYDIQLTAQRLLAEVEEGKSFATAVGTISWLPSGLPSLIKWAEGNQTLSDTLHLIASMFESRARSYSHSTAKLLSVLIVTLVIMGIGIVTIALFVPMLTLISKLSG